MLCNFSTAVQLNSIEPFLSEMRFFLTGFSKVHETKIASIIHARSGFILDSLSATITHMICLSESINRNQDIETYKIMTGPRPFVLGFGTDLTVN